MYQAVWPKWTNCNTKKKIKQLKMEYLYMYTELQAGNILMNTLEKR